MRLEGDSASVSEAAFGAGYGSGSAFIAAFRRVHRVTPARYFTAEYPVVAG
ncbi:MAG: helix-turn-helix transcriptional regulator [Gemmatimonadetes bacterium]|nr:helix-turn-helix transcriptional regulator [Gemmatimonadota bacterium]